jgi:hypothetical protein
MMLQFTARSVRQRIINKQFRSICIIKLLYSAIRDEIINHVERQMSHYRDCGTAVRSIADVNDRGRRKVAERGLPNGSLRKTARRKNPAQEYRNCAHRRDRAASMPAFGRVQCEMIADRAHKNPGPRILSLGNVFRSEPIVPALHPVHRLAFPLFLSLARARRIPRQKRRRR